MSDEKPDLMEARRAFERDVVTDAYDYALAALGCSRSGGCVMRLSGRDAEQNLEYAQSKLLGTAKLLAAGLVVDARLAPLAALDRLLGAHGRSGVAISDGGDDAGGAQ